VLNCQNTLLQTAFSARFKNLTFFIKYQVQVTDEEGGTFEFPCNEWLSDTKGGGKLERELNVRSNIPTVS